MKKYYKPEITKVNFVKDVITASYGTVKDGAHDIDYGKDII